MQVTVEIPQEIIDAFTIAFRDWMNREPTTDEMQRFFDRDVIMLYCNLYIEDLDDAVEDFFDNNSN